MKKFMLLTAAVAGISLFAMHGTAEAHGRGLYRGGFYGPGVVAPYHGAGWGRHGMRGGYWGGPRFHRGYHRFHGPRFGRGFHRGPRFFFGGPRFGIMIR